MEEPYERLSRARRDAGFADATEAAKAKGWNENTYRSHENGQRGLKPKTAAVYAKAFRVSAGWLLTGEGSGRRSAVPLVGYVGADSRPDAVAFLDGQDNLDHDLPLPPNVTSGTLALVVKGISMRSVAKNGWVIYYDGDRVVAPPFPELIGELCVCWLDDGRALFKEIHKGTAPGLFNLESMNADTLRDQRVVKASRVTAIVPRGRRPDSDVLEQRAG